MAESGSEIIVLVVALIVSVPGSIVIPVILGGIMWRRLRRRTRSFAEGSGS